MRLNIYSNYICNISLCDLPILFVATSRKPMMVDAADISLLLYQSTFSCSLP